MDTVPPKENKFKKFIFKHLLTLLFLFLSVIIYIWFTIQLNVAEKKNNKQKQEIVSTYNLKLDSLSSANIKLTTQVLGWAVRSELLRNNTEQVEIFFNSFVKEPNISRLDLIDPETKTIIKSTDKKMEGAPVKNEAIFTLSNNGVAADTANALIISPIMGLDKKIGILVVALNK